MARKIKIGLIGASGRMGRAFQDVFASSKEHEFHLAISKIKIDAAKNTQPKAEASSMAAQVDVWIDFSAPELLTEVLALAVKNKRPIVIGTTGYSEKQKAQIEKAAQIVPIVYSGNMSVGIQILLKALEAFQNTSGFDFQIEEIHHNKKKDAPSGTALMIKKKLDAVIEKKSSEVVSIRGGGVFGIHKVMAMAEEEIVTIEHTALSRTVFARGALVAAKGIIKKKPGLYALKDVI